MPGDRPPISLFVLCFSSAFSSAPSLFFFLFFSKKVRHKERHYKYNFLRHYGVGPTTRPLKNTYHGYRRKYEKISTHWQTEPCKKLRTDRQTSIRRGVQNGVILNTWTRHSDRPSGTIKTSYRRCGRVHKNINRQIIISYPKINFLEFSEVELSAVCRSRWRWALVQEGMPELQSAAPRSHPPPRRSSPAPCLALSCLHQIQ